MRTFFAIIALLTAATASAEPSREACLQLIRDTHDCIHNPDCRSMTLDSLEAELKCLDQYGLEDEARAADDAARRKYEADESII